MSKFIYFEQFRQTKQEQQEKQQAQKSRTVRTVILGGVLAIWLIFYFVLFFTKGIYINGTFYKKIPNITNITYSALEKNIKPAKIILTKKIGNSATIQIDTEVIVVSDIKNPSGQEEVSFTVEGYGPETSDIFGLPYDEIGPLVTQQKERNRGNVSQLVIVAVMVGLILLAKLNATRLFYLTKKDKAPSEGYYTKFTIAFWLACFGGLLYLTLVL